MSHIFVSYSSQDQSFALRLADQLKRFYQVWIDREGMSGGLQWERAIEDALKACEAFLVIVSPNSNDSEWVARETIRAEQLEKYRIPALLDGELPLRLLNLHYIDFRGDYEGGFRDLLTVLKKRLKGLDPKDQKSEIDNLIGAGVMAYLAQDYPRANNLIGQALALDPKIADSVEAFWARMRETRSKDLATKLIAKIEILETAKLVPQIAPGPQLYEWSVEIDVPQEILDQIDYVVYELHQTFTEPIQVVRSRDTRFRLTRIGWGIFTIPITVHFKDGSTGQLSHDLTFESA